MGKLAGERASLLKKLVEVEMDGKAAGEQLIKLRDTIRKLKEVKLRLTWPEQNFYHDNTALILHKTKRFLRHESRSSFSNQDKRMSAADTTLLTRQREMLLQKLDEFERTNKALRRLLREQQATEVLQGNLILYNSR